MADDDSDLGKLKAKLNQINEDIKKLNGQADPIRSEINKLEIKLGEIEKASGGYDKTSADLQTELDGVRKTISRKRTIAEAGVKDLADLIDKKIVEFDKALADQAKSTEKATKDASLAAESSAESADNLQKQQEELATLKSLPKTLTQNLKGLKSLIDLTVKAETEDDMIALYLYSVEAAEMVATISIPKPEEYKKQLGEALDRVAEAKIKADEAKNASDKLASVAADTKKKYDAAVTSRRADLLKALHEIKPPVPAPAPAQAPSPSRPLATASPA